ncbi:MAG: N-acetylneuraminate synthase family protein, partial [bacterium]
TLARGSWGSDQAASLEPDEFAELIAGIRTLKAALGDGVKRLYDSEIPVREKLRRVG